MNSKCSDLATRMKRYEAAYQYKLTPRSCLFIRLDGKAFHTFTKDCQRPFDDGIINSMEVAMEKTAGEMQGFKGAYTQSDECTFMLTDFDNLQSQGWFGYELQKIASVSASIFTAYFNKAYELYRFPSKIHNKIKPAFFDSRAFIVPQEDAANVFIWRQQDWNRNSVQMLARTHFSHKELHGKHTNDLHEMLHEKGINWADLDDIYKNGAFYFGSDIVTDKLNYEELDARLFDYS